MAKFKNKVLNVNNMKISSNELSYNDLVWLYNDFIRRNNKVPTMKECKSSNNLPSPKIVMEILSENNVLYKDFIFQFGKTKNVRMTNINEYDYYLEKLLNTFRDIGETLPSAKLTDYGLPSSSWYIKYCPEKSVTTFKEFLNYYGLAQTKHIWTKEEFDNALIEYEKIVNRPITRNDFTPEKLGVSTIVLNRIYGSLSNAKNELGLMKTTKRFQPLPFEHYKEILTEALLDYKSKNDTNYITWKSLESGEYGAHKINHKSIHYAFQRANEDLYAYLSSFDLCLKPNVLSKTYTFDDGEMTDSNYEYLVSTYLREKGFKYNVDYFRSVKYSTFEKKNSKRTCDYLVKTKSGDVYIEVAGLLYKPQNKDWRKQKFNNKLLKMYLEKMIMKEEIFKKYNLNYVFIFSNEMASGLYKDILLSVLADNQNVA